MMAGRPQGRFRCGEQLQDGSTCGEVFTRAGNLQRHVRVQHQADMPGRFRFVYMVPDGEGDLRAEQDESCGDAPASLPAHGCADLAATAREWKAAVDSIARHAESIATSSSNIASMVATDATSAGGAPNNKRKRGPPADGEDDGAPPVSWDRGFRFGRVAYRSPMPQYPVKQSRASPPQQCALSWLSSRTKARVDKSVGQLMRSWGVGIEHEASCILVPAKWKKRNPAQVLAQVSFEECNNLESDRLELKADDHQTTFARAVAWFNDWGSPKRGIDLDNFLESGPFQRMDGSHLCHHALCINRNHVQYEPASVNQERMSCLDEARQMRRNRQEVPWGCSLHTPPCMLQLAVLTTFEAIQVQRSVFFRGAEEPHEPRPPRPRQHRFPTFETRLPLSYAAPGANADPKQGAMGGDIAGGGHGRLPKPDLCCPFCTSARRVFNSVVGFWAHIVQVHEEEEDAERAAAVRSSAGEWQEYWLARGLLPPASSPTLLKVTQALGPAFSWADVMSWDLRP